MQPRLHKQFLKCQVLSLSTIAALIAFPASMQAATINRSFIGGSPPTNTSGQGNLIDIFNTAANYWESAILDEITISIDFGWANLAETSLAEFFPLEQTENRALEGEILFNTNTTLFNWFLDETPKTNEEFGSLQVFSEDFGTGSINTGRVFSAPSSEAQGNFDLLSIAIHELGHAFGILNDYETFDIETEDDDIDIAAGLPFAGGEIPTTPLNGGHVDLPSAAMDPFFERGQRTLLSEVDILAAASTSHLSNINLNPQPINQNHSLVQTPESSASLGFITLLGYRLQRKKKSGDRLSSTR